MLTLKELRENLHYDPETGALCWKSHPAGKYVVPGRPTGLTPSVRHRKISIFGKRYLVHRVIWFWMTGSWPDGLIDHKDRDPTNNRWQNLRVANYLQNVGNTGKKRQNKCGLKGIMEAGSNRWAAQISKNYRSTHIGTFDCPAAAHFAYLIEAHKHFGDFA